MNGISLTISTIGVILTLLGLFFSNLRRSDDVKFERYKEKGTDYKKEGKLSAAMNFYNRAEGYAGNREQKADIWSHITFLQMDRALAAHSKYYEYSQKDLKYTDDDGEEHFWFFNGKKPSWYTEPSRSEILK